MDSVRCIVDTDAGPDDVMALAWLLSRHDVVIEAITIAYGLAHAWEGAINMSRVVALAGRDIPVYIGHDEAHAAFPDELRTLSDTLPGVDLPSEFRAPEREPAPQFLARRLNDRAAGMIRVLALGALDNLAAAIGEGSSGAALEDVVIMGGAFDVAGNVKNAGSFVSPTNTAEWNFFVDPPSTRTVLGTNVPTLVIPLDATNDVPVTPQFIDHFQAAIATPLGQMTGRVLQLIRPFAARGIFFAWDPLAAVAMLYPEVIRTRVSAVSVLCDGTTRRAEEGPLKRIAFEADRELFTELYLSEFTRPGVRLPT